MKIIGFITGVLLLASTASSQHELSFLVTFDSQMQQQPAHGRLTVYLIKTDSGMSRRAPADAPFFANPQPMFSIGVDGLKPGEVAVVDDNAEFFPVLPSELPLGRYRAQAVLDQSHGDSSWKNEPGNLYSSPNDVVFHVTQRGVSAPVHIQLRERTRGHTPRNRDGLLHLAVRSELLSDFRGEDVYLRAGIVSPMDMDSDRRYPVVYQVPGFGGNHTGASGVLRRHESADPDSDLGKLARNAYWVVLDPEGPNGHHLFADSANNGPVGRALTEELIPAIDAACRTIPEASARLLRGHSSGGWSCIWLGIAYPDTFGGIWSSSPDPVDFSSFQSVNIYSEANMYRREMLGQIVWTPSYTDEKGIPGMTILQENRMEEVMGPGNTSGQQWDSWLAAFGPIGNDGSPANLYNAQTGVINSRVATQYAKYDISRLLRNDRARLGPLMKDRLRLVVGEMDNYNLDEAVYMLKRKLDALTFTEPDGGNTGYITIVPGLDHSSIYGSDELRDYPGQMFEELARHGHVKIKEGQ